MIRADNNTLTVFLHTRTKVSIQTIIAAYKKNIHGAKNLSVKCGQVDRSSTFYRKTKRIPLKRVYPLFIMKKQNTVNGLDITAICSTQQPQAIPNKRNAA